MLTMGCCRSKVTAIDQNAGISSNVNIVANAPIKTLPIPNIEVHYESDEQLGIKGKSKLSIFNKKISIVQKIHLDDLEKISNLNVYLALQSMYLY